MATVEAVKPGVYRAPSGHTIVINKHHPEDAPVPEGYVRIASEEEFAAGTFHPYLQETPADWDPTTFRHGGNQGAWAPAGAPVEADPDAAKKAVAAEKKASDAIKANADLQKQIDDIKAGQDKAIADAVAKALEAATK